MTLVEHDVGVAAAIAAAEEMIETDLVEGCGRRVGRDVAADTVGFAVCAHDHGQRVPPDETLDAALEGAVTGPRHLFAGRDRIDVGRRRRVCEAYAAETGARPKSLEQPCRPSLVALVEHVVERLEPFARLDRFEGRGF